MTTPLPTGPQPGTSPPDAAPAGPAASNARSAAAPGLHDTLVLVPNDGMGQADPELTRKLFAKWLELAEANGTLPGAIAFYTRGVHLVCEGSPALDRLRAFEAQGVRLILCKTCIDFFGVADRVRVGVVGGMGDILAAQAMARKVITL